MKVKITSKFSSYGFTLLEVMIASVIFSIVVSALYSTFRIGMKAYRIGQENMDELQQVRFIFDTFTKDVRSVYYLDESAYNTQANSRINKFEREHLLAIEKGEEDNFLALYDENLAKLLGKEDKIETKENPYNLGISIDLKMNASDGGDFDKITLARYNLSEKGTRNIPWGISRVEWRVENERMIRAEKPIFMPERDLEGEVATETPERIDVLSKNIVRFDLYFGYFCAGKWLETSDWDSAERKYRNPLPELDPDDTDYSRIEQLKMHLPDDGLPAYVRMELVIADSKQKAGTDDVSKRRPRVFSTIVSFPPSQENFIPLLEDDSDLYEITYGRTPDGKPVEIVKSGGSGSGSPGNVAAPPQDATLPGIYEGSSDVIRVKQ